MDNRPNGDDDPPSHPITPYQQTVRQLSDRLIAAQRPVRVLDAIQWNVGIERAFLSRGGRELPPVTADSYASRPLCFDPAEKVREFQAIERDSLRQLGRGDPVAMLLRRRCRQYRGAVALLACRGTRDFARLSRDLYGGPEAGEDAHVAATFAALAHQAPHVEPSAVTFDAATAVAVLDTRLGRSFPDGCYRVKLADGILADAAAGCDYIKLRRDARFAPADLALLEVHEGWVHLGTTLNGRRQPICSFLGKGPPATCGTQEGLAVFCEVLAGVCHAGRVRKLWRRYQAVRLAENGADFRDIYRFFLNACDDPRDSYHQAARVFRGSLPTGCGPFAKDLAYALGFTRILKGIREMLRSGRRDRVALLFCGKTALEDVPILSALTTAGVVDRPAYMPPPLANSAALGRLLTALPTRSPSLQPPHLFDEVFVSPLAALPHAALSFQDDARMAEP